MHTSFISTIRLRNKWQVVEKNPTTSTVNPVPNEDYDDECTANIAGRILAKMLKLSFIPDGADKTPETKNSNFRLFS